MSKDRDIFIKKYANDVINATKGTGIFPSVKMAQFIIESSNSKGQSGQGITMVKANNGFGIKADKSWKGIKMVFNTPKDGKPVSVFRVYSTPYDSIVDHTKFLQSMPRYTKAGVFTAKSPEAQVDAIAKAGYSESPTYATAIKKMISAYNLKALDSMAGIKPSTNYKPYVVGAVLIAVAAYGYNEYSKNRRVPVI